MKNTGYYEIKTNRIFGVELKAAVLAGNVQFNRLHWHEHLEILCCVHGSFNVRVDGIVYHLKEGDIITINSGASHEIFDGLPNGLQIIVSIDPSLLQKEETEIYDFSTVGDTAISAHSEEVKTLRSSLGKMAWLLTPEVEVMSQAIKTYKDILLQNRHIVLKTEEEWNCFHMELYRVLMYLASHKRKAEAAKNVSAPKSAFTECVEILHREYGQPLSAKILSERVGVSEPTIYRMFQKQLGVSFITYLNSIRVNAACGYMENKELSIIEIADCCGFSSLSNFYRVFHLHKGQSPRTYRKDKGDLLLGNDLTRQDIMELNRFQSFWELPYDRRELLL
jgi:AraC-like DNA-binding protein/mannose-6-phosphate isomerase-like protein (cupin superfamily)